MSKYGKCFWCDHEFDTAEVSHDGHPVTVQNYGGYGTTTYHDHTHDRCHVDFLPGLFMCQDCLSESRKYQNKLGKFDHRSESCKAADREVEKRRKAALERCEAFSRLFNPKTYAHPSLAAYYRQVQSGKVDIGLKASFRLVESGAPIKSKGLVKGASVRTMEEAERQQFLAALVERDEEFERAERNCAEREAKQRAGTPAIAA